MVAAARSHGVIMSTDRDELATGPVDLRHDIRAPTSVVETKSTHFS